jgi:hypothetical protein
MGICPTVGRTKPKSEEDMLMADETSSNAPAEVELDPEVGRVAFERLLPLLTALDPETLTPATAKVNLAATFVLGIEPRLREEPLRSQLLAMPTLRASLIEQLSDMSWATWYVWTMFQDAEALKTGVRVPPDLIDRASERRLRMLMLLEYHLGDDPSVARTLSSIRAGAGYQDTASDLVRSARLYRQHHAIVASDTKLYRADDEPQAREDAAAILQTLAAGERSREEWSDQLTRCWTLLNRAYDEAIAALSWLYRDDPGVLEAFPSLYSVARPGVGRRRSRAETESRDGSPNEPNGGATSNDAATPPGATPPVEQVDA